MGFEVLIPQLINIATPIVLQVIEDHRAANNGQMPTPEEVEARFRSNLATYLGEGTAWRLQHPDA